VGTIERRDVAQLLNAIADPPRNAPASSDHVRAFVSRLFRFGISQGIEAIEYNPAHGIDGQAGGATAPRPGLGRGQAPVARLGG
jgi:hypothetical protein